MRKPEQVVTSVMKKLEKHGKGIILMHDFQQATAKAAPDLLQKLKDGGYKVVQVVGKTPVEPKRNTSTWSSRRWAAALKRRGPCRVSSRPSTATELIKENLGRPRHAVRPAFFAAYSSVRPLC
jgi:hypothetical protein